MAKLPIQRVTRFGQDVAPDFDIHVAGKGVPRLSNLFNMVRPLIAQITYEEDEKLASLLEVTVINQPVAEIGRPIDWTAVVDAKELAEGNYLDLWIGYYGSNTYKGRFEIVKWLPQFPEAGPATLVIKAYDARHKMMEGNQIKTKKGSAKKRKTYYRNMPDEMIVTKIALKYGYLYDTDPTETKRHTKVTSRSGSSAVKKSVYPTRVQNADVTDWQFLLRLAEINRFDLWVDFDIKRKANIVHFKKRKDAGQAEYLFTWNGQDGSLISGEPAFVINKQATDVEVHYYDRSNKKQTLTVIQDLNKAENVKVEGAKPGRMKAQKAIEVGARVRFTAFGQTLEAFSDKPFRSRAEAATFAANWLKEKERDLLTMRGTVVGVETLRPRQIHEFGGMSTRIDGLFRLTQARHILAPGSLYRVEVMGARVLSQEISRRKATTKATS